MIVGTYPDPYLPADRPGLQAVGDLLDQLSFGRADVHVLPFYPSSGDGGFAADDWFSVDPAFGGSEDLAALAERRGLMIDGIYNHVGTGHRWWRDAQRWGDAGRCFFSFEERPDDSVIGGRKAGGTGFIRVRLGDSWKWVWQTFGPASVDVNLDSPGVGDAVREHLSWAAGLGVRLIRLDACAFYGKSLSAESLHQPFSYEAVRRLANWRDCVAPGVWLLAQVDIDPTGLGYLRGDRGRAGADFVYDYSFSALVAHALLCHEGAALARHINRTGRQGVRSVRPARTHDGVYLRSRLLDPRVRRELGVQVAEHGLLATRLGSELFEINASLPLMCRLASGGETAAGWRRIGLAMAVCIASSNLPYLYLPALFGFAPEVDADLPAGRPESDLRLVNRVPMPREYVTRALDTAACREMALQLDAMSGAGQLDEGWESGVPRASWLPGAGLLVIRRSRHTLVANLGRSAGVPPDPVLAGTRVVARLGLDGRRLLGGGFVLLCRPDPAQGTGQQPAG